MQESHLPEQDPNVQAQYTSQLDSPSHKNSSALVKIFIVFIFGLLIGAAGLWAWTTQQNSSVTNKSEDKDKSTNLSELTDQMPSVEPNSNQSDGDQIIYISNYYDGGNIILRNKKTQETRLITNDAQSVDGTRTIWYNSPTFITQNKIGYSRCVREGTTHKDQYKCSLVTKNLESGEEKLITQTASSLNRNDYQIGGEINNITFSHTNRYVAFSTSNPSNQDSRVITLQNLNDLEESQMFMLGLTAGRGGYIDDDDSLHFSKDDKYLLINSTISMPTKEGDSTTLLIYDITQNPATKVYTADPGVMVTLGRWLNNNLAVAKQNTTDMMGSKLISIDPRTGTAQSIKENIDNWSYFVPIEDSETEFVFITPQEDRGIYLKKYNIETQEVSQLANNLIPLKADSDQVAVRTGDLCNNDPNNINLETTCGMGAYYDFIPSGYGFLKIDTGVIEQLGTSQYKPQFSARSSDVWLN